MHTPITLGDAILLIIGICGILLLIYLIRALRVIIPTLQALRKILEDTQHITGIISNAAVGVEDTLSETSAGSEDLKELIGNHKASFAAIVNIINTIAALKKLFN